MKKFTFLRNTLAAIVLLASTSVLAQPLTPTFTEATTVLNGGKLKMQFEAAAAWGDFDNDGYLDLITTGRSDNGPEYTALYKNNGDGTFTELTHTIAHVRGNPSLTWLDYDNDGNLDLFLTGRSEEAPLNENGQDGKTAKLYKGNGDGTFVEVFEDFFYGVNNNNDNANRTRSVAVADYNNDGWVDIYYHGDNNGKQGRLYKNNQGTGFTLIDTPVDGTDELLKFDSGSAAWGDVNNDGYLDLFVSGVTPDGKRTVIYLNNGDGTLATPYYSNVGAEKGEQALLDFDNDGQLDYIVTGWCGDDDYSWMNSIYQNNGDMTFTEIKSDVSNLPGTESTSLDYGDVNNDGHVDIIMTRSHPNAVFLNNAGDGTFTRVNLPDGHNWERGAASFADYDNDGFMDALTMGEGYDTNLYRNEGGAGISANTAPSVPTDLDAVTGTDGVVTFTWAASTDPEGSSLQYNLYVKKSDGTFITFLLPAIEATGKLKVNERLAGLVTTSYKMTGLVYGEEYTFGVSAIDNGKMSSAFATKVFTIQNTTGINSNLSAKTPKSVQYFDLTGKAVNGTAKGIVIKKTIYKDGSVENSKEIK